MILGLWNNKPKNVPLHSASLLLFLVLLLVKDASLGAQKLEATPKVTEGLVPQEARGKCLLDATVYFLSSL